MTTFTYTQSSWSRGEIDERLWAKYDWDGYKKAARSLENLLVTPQTGLKKRFGTDFVYALTTVTDSDECKIEVLEFTNGAKYLVIYEDLKVTILSNDVFLTNVTSPYTAAQIINVRTSQSDNVLISVHPDVIPHKLFLETSPSTFAYEKIAFKNEPTYDFLDNYDHVMFKLGTGSHAFNTSVPLTIDSTLTYPAIISMVDMINNTPIVITTGDRYIHTGANGTLGGVAIEKGDILQKSPTVWVRNPNGSSTDTAPANNSVVLNNSDSTYYIFNSTAQVWNVYGSTLFQFSDNYVGGIFIGNEGTMRITSFVSATQVLGTIIDVFKNTDPFPGTEAVLTEPIFNNKINTLRSGYPASVGFYQNRLWLAALPSLPSGIWSSKSGAANFFDFDDSSNDPEYGVSAFVTTGKTNIIRYILGVKNMFVFSTANVSATDQLDSSGITPTNISLSTQSNNGIGYVQPVYFDEQIIYVDEGGKIINSLIFSVEVESYSPKDISIQSQHLIKQPVSIETFRNPTDDNGLYLIVVNADGTLAILQSLKSEDVNAWTPAHTSESGDHYFRHVAASQDDIYFIVERTINSVKKFYVEKLNFDSYTDCTISGALGTPGKTITGLSVLEGETVQLTADGFYYGKFIVSSGSITANTNQPNFTNYSVGIEIVPILIPLPINIQTQEGDIFYLPKMYRTVILDYFETLGLTINNEQIPELTADSSTFDSLPIPVSGFSKLDIMAGWDVYQTITISQVVPFALFIRAIQFIVQIN